MKKQRQQYTDRLIRWEHYVHRGNPLWDAMHGGQRLAQVTHRGDTYQTFFNVTKPGDGLTDYIPGAAYDSLPEAKTAVEAILRKLDYYDRKGGGQ